MRDAHFYPNPASSYRFIDGDLIAVIGESGQLDAFRALAVLPPRGESLVEKP
jgi:hypothetical protein